MIEINANGTLYVADYFMPRDRLFRDRMIITIANFYEQRFTHIGIDQPPSYAPVAEVWKFKKILNHTGDIRWEFLGDISAYGRVIEYFLKKIGRIST